MHRNFSNKIFFFCQISVPLAIVWGALFSLLTLIFIWILSPLLRVLELLFAIFKRVSRVEIDVSKQTC
jgi:Caveolin